MLTRLKVSGFKNLVGVDVRLGPFTCIAGANAVGKSNLFDAIRLLSALADQPLLDAARSVRDEAGRTADIRSLFHRVGDRYADEMSFEAEMIVPREGRDDLGQPAEATITFLRYSLTLGYRADEETPSLGRLDLRREELVRIKVSDASRRLLFPHSLEWRRSAIRGRRSSPFISTGEQGPDRIIKRHQDGQQGRALSHRATDLPRTILSVSSAAESPTALLARREMQSWRLLQLEPSALRKPDEFTAPARLGSDGSNLAATLFRLARTRRGRETNERGSPGQSESEHVYARIANRLSELIDDIHAVSIDRDERRELLTLTITGRDGTPHPARSLSDGTLRFLALAVIELDPQSDRLLCLEEPENGVHPERILAMLRLLQDISVDARERISNDNPLRQVVVNTHSPAVVMQVPEETLLVAELSEAVDHGQRFKRLSFGCLPGTWRAKDGKMPTVPKGQLLSYLNPVPPKEAMDDDLVSSGKPKQLRFRQRTRRVVDRPDVQALLPFPASGE